MFLHMSELTPVACPDCRKPFTPGETTCPRCHLRLVGPDAARLWVVDQQIAGLTLERVSLITALRGPGPVNSPLNTPIGVAPTKSPSGQQVLLGLGALVLLGAVSLFLLAFWLVVGVAGQSAILTGLITASVAAAGLAVAKRLPAAAETAAIITVGLLALGFNAIHSLNLAGLGDIASFRYWTGALLSAAALLTGFHFAMPRGSKEAPLRRVETYRPAASVALAGATWCALIDYSPHHMALVIALLVVALVNGALAVVALRVDLRSIHESPVAVPFVGSAALASVGFVAVALANAYNLDGAAIDRYGAATLLAIVPALLVALTTSGAIKAVVALGWNRTTLVPIAVATALPTMGVPLLDTSYWGILVVAAALAPAVIWRLRHGRLAEDGGVPAAWDRSLVGLGLGLQPFLMACLAFLYLDGETTLRAGLHLDGQSTTPSIAAVVVAGALWVTTASIGLIAKRNENWVALLHFALAATLGALLWESTTRTWTVAALIYLIVHMTLASLAARRIPAVPTLVAPESLESGADVPLVERLGAKTWPWAAIEAGSICSGAFAAAIAVFCAVDAFDTAIPLAMTFYVIGAAVLGYATSPGRIWFGYVGSIIASIGTWVLLNDAHIDVIEAYTLPLAGLLAGIGTVQYMRGKKVGVVPGTMTTMGPALTVAIGPTTMFAMGTDDTLRFLLTIVALVGLVLAGVNLRLKAPVLFAGLALSGITIIKMLGLLGNPLLFWPILFAGGASLITAGVMWEKAVVGGKKAATWFERLR
jgi:hypothetical protein